MNHKHEHSERHHGHARGQGTATDGSSTNYFNGNPTPEKAIKAHQASQEILNEQFRNSLRTRKMSNFMTQQTKYDSQEQAAAALAVPLHVIRRAKRQGCPAFANGRVDGVKLRQWLAKHPNKARPTAKVKTMVPAVGLTGTPAALRRLEGAEREAYLAWQRALASDAPDGDGHQLRRGWLEISEALRKADIVLEEHRRDAGELVERKLVEQALWLFSYYVNAAWMANLHHAVAAIQGQPTMTTADLHKVLSDRLQYNVLLSAAAGMTAADKKVPAWLTRASVAFWTQFPYTKMGEEVDAVAEILKQALATPPPTPLAPTTEEVKP